MKVQQLEGLSWMWNTSPVTMVWFQSFMDLFQQFGLVFVPQSMEWKIAHFPCKMQFQWLLEKVLKLPSINGMEDCSCLVLICFNVKVWFLLWLLFNRKLFCLVLFEFFFFVLFSVYSYWSWRRYRFLFFKKNVSSTRRPTGTLGQR